MGGEGGGGRGCNGKGGGPMEKGSSEETGQVSPLSEKRGRRERERREERIGVWGRQG